MKVYIFSDADDYKMVASRMIDESQIVGFSDDLTSDKCLELSAKGIDVIIASNERKRRILEDQNLPLRIITFSDFTDATFATPLDKIDAKVLYNRIVLGMSHVQCMIDACKVENRDFLNLALPSMDMFLQYHCLEKVLCEYREALMHVKSVIIELPYYIFNYDLSRFGNYTLTKLKYFESIGDYHHFGEFLKGRNKIEEFRIWCSLFKEKDKPDYNNSRDRLIWMKRWYHQLLIIKKRDKVWSGWYKDTLQENVNYFDRIIRLINMELPEAEITVLVMPFNPIFRWSHIKQVRRMKRLFYQVLSQYKLRIVDDFTLFKRSVWFDDHCHLNLKGARRYMQYLQSKEMGFFEVCNK